MTDNWKGKGKGFNNNNNIQQQISYFFMKEKLDAMEKKEKDEKEKKDEERKLERFALMIREGVAGVGSLITNTAGSSGNTGSTSSVNPSNSGTSNVTNDSGSQRINEEIIASLKSQQEMMQQMMKNTQHYDYQAKGWKGQNDYMNDGNCGGDIGYKGYGKGYDMHYGKGLPPHANHIHRDMYGIAYDNAYMNDNLNGNAYGNFNGHAYGNAYGNFNGNVAGNPWAKGGNFNGNAYGNINGNFNGNPWAKGGNFNGNAHGNINGEFNGNLGAMGGNFNGNAYGNINPIVGGNPGAKGGNFNGNAHGHINDNFNVNAGAKGGNNNNNNHMAINHAGNGNNNNAAIIAPHHGGGGNNNNNIGVNQNDEGNAGNGGINDGNDVGHGGNNDGNINGHDGNGQNDGADANNGANNNNNNNNAPAIDPDPELVTPAELQFIMANAFATPGDADVENADGNAYAGRPIGAARSIQRINWDQRRVGECMMERLVMLMTGAEVFTSQIQTAGRPKTALRRLGVQGVSNLYNRIPAVVRNQLDHVPRQDNIGGLCDGVLSLFGRVQVAVPIAVPA